MWRERPVLFISYTATSRKQVLSLVASLRRDGCECLVDVHKRGGGDWPTWMTRSLERSDFVLCVLTPDYCRRFEGHEQPDVGHGVAWEASLIRQLLYERKMQSDGVIVLQFDRRNDVRVPLELRGCTHFVLEQQADYEQLLRMILDRPEHEPAVVGTPPDLPAGTTSPLFERPMAAVAAIDRALPHQEAPLLRYPIGPMVRALEIPMELVETFSARFEGNPAAAAACLARAMQARRRANPEGFTERQILVSSADLPDPRQGLQDYWASALILAGQKSRRTLAAVLLTDVAPDARTLTDPAASIMTSFLQWLRGETEAWSPK